MRLGQLLDPEPAEQQGPLPPEIVSDCPDGFKENIYCLALRCSRGDGGWLFVPDPFQTLGSEGVNGLADLFQV